MVILTRAVKLGFAKLLDCSKFWEQQQAEFPI